MNAISMRDRKTGNNWTEADRYNAAWATGDYLPMIGLAYTKCLYRTRFFEEYNTILDVGCGTGAAVVYHRVVGGKQAYGIDFAEYATDTWNKLSSDKWCTVASAENIPFGDNRFDMVSCTDVLEHVPEVNVRQVLSEIRRVGNNDFLFIISLIPAKEKMPHDGSEPHVCIKPPEWWIEQIGRAGFRFRQYPYANHTLFAYARKNAPEHRRYKPLQ